MEDDASFEYVQVANETIRIPSYLCQANGGPALDQIFSLSTWNGIPGHVQEHLVKFLPKFEKDDQKEKIKTLKMLLSGNNIKFGNPVNEFKKKLSEGHYNSDNVKMSELLKKIDRRHSRENERQRQCRLFQEIVYTRKKVLLPSSNDRIQQNFSQDSRKHTGSEFNHKVAKRYFEELNMIRQEAGESGNSSEDENFPDGPPSKISTLKRDDIDRIYSEYVKITLKSSENTKAKPQMVVKSSKSDGSGNPERVKRKYKKRQKEQHVVQNNSVSLLKPAGQSQPGQNYTINQNGTELAQRQQPIGFHDQFDRQDYSHNYVLLVCDTMKIIFKKIK